MGRKLKDRTGHRVGRLTVISFSRMSEDSKDSIWNVRCDCGTEKEVRAKHLVNNGTLSCGCYAKERSSEAHSSDLIGKRFGKLIVLERIGSKNKSATWLCRCDCGREKVVSSHSLNIIGTKSCGCLISDVYTAYEFGYRHHKTNTKLYKIWARMRQRCNNGNSSDYMYYGGRGVKVCEEWNTSFSAFYEWAILNGYEEGLTIDRIDVNGHYCPENCQWLTNSENVKKKHHIDKYVRKEKI